MSKLKRAHTQSWATWVVVAFLVVAGLLGLSIAYFSFAKTTVNIIPEPQPFSAQVDVTLNQVDGALLTSNKDGSLEYTQITAEKEEPDFATGTVTLHNETGADQPLVPTTRLLSDGGILFRTQEHTVIPARGTVEVPVKADQAGAEGNITASHFEIVALHEGQKAKIYGQSSGAMTGGIKKTGVLVAKDLKAAKKQLEIDLVKTAVADLLTQASAAQLPTDNITAEKVIVERSEETQSAQIGDTVNSITVGMKIHVTAITFDSTKLETLVSTQAKTQAPEGTSLVGLEKLAEYAYALPAEPTPPDQPVKITVTATGTTILALTSPLLDRTKIVNKDEQDIKTYFSNFEEVKDVEITFRPFWIKRAPALVDHILIQIADTSSTNTNL